MTRECPAGSCRRFRCLEQRVADFAIALGTGAVLLIGAFVSKFLAAFLPALVLTDRRRATLLGVSMIPRAEIALLVMKGGQEAGASIVPDDFYLGMVLVSAGTCLGAPLILSRLFRSWTDSNQDDS
jgi:Kef-type K+ transport system membrane component KefB